MNHRALPVTPAVRVDTRRHNASMSATELLLDCQWWANSLIKLPPEPEDPKLYDLPPRFGIAFHETMEKHLGRKQINLSLIAATYNVDVKELAHFYKRGSEFVDKLLRKRGWFNEERMIETKVAYDPFADRSRILPSTKTRDYSDRKPTELPGTMDLGLPRRKSKKPFVVFDWKSGHKVYDAKTNAQMRSLSCGMDRLLDPSDHRTISMFSDEKKNEVRGIKILVRIDAEFIEDYEAPVTYGEMLQHRDALRRAMKTALSQSPHMRPGPHCEWCKANVICPSQVGPLAIRDLWDMATDPVEAGQIYGQIITLEKVVERGKKWFGEFVRMNGPSPLDNGKYAQIERAKRETISKASIRRNLPLDEAEALIEKLEAMGCVEVREYDNLRQVADPNGKR